MPSVSPPTAPLPTWLRPLGLGLLLGALAWLAWVNAPVLAPFALSVALAYVLRPGVDALQRRRVPRALGAALVVLVTMTLLVFLAMLLVPIVVELAPRARDQLPDLAERLWHLVVPHLQTAGVKVPSALSDLKPMVAKMLSTHGDAWAQTALSSLRVGGSWLFTLMGLALLVPMLAFYWLLDWSDISPRVVALVPPRWRAPLADVLGECDTVMGRYLRGQLLVMLALAVFYSVGLALFSFDLALPIGVFTGLAVFIPYLGFGLGLLLAVLSGVLQAAGEGGPLWWPLLGVAVVYGLGQLIESMVLTPRLVGEQIGLHPGAVILILMLYGQWLGFVGVLVALPVSALLLVLLRRGLGFYRQSAWYVGAAPRE
jgi:predicted PurR-regulated permease PerM